MIPLKLTLKNFVAYGDPPVVIPWDEIASPVVVTGRNGAGKSTIMDAITWALWGQPSSESDLVRWGADAMAVEYEFELDDQRYRVRRTYSREKAQRKETAGTLSFERWVGGEEPWRVVAGGMKQAQAAINETLRLDHRLFASTVYLAQRGGPDFATAGPSERIQILADIAVSGLYERLTKNAKEEAARMEAEDRSLGLMAGALESEVVAARTAAEELSVVRPELARAEALLTEAVSDDERYQALLAAESAAAARRRDAESERARLDERRRTVETAIAAARAVIARHSGILARAADIDAAEAAAATLREELAALDQVADRSRALDREIAAAEATHREALAAHAAKVEQIRDRITIAERAAAALPEREGDLARIDAELTTIAEQETALAAAREAMAEAVTRRSTMASELKRLEEEGQTLAAGLKSIQEGDSCPTCLQTMDGEHRAAATARVDQELATMRERYRLLKEEQQSVIRAEATERERVTALTAAVGRRAALDGQRGRFVAEIDALRARAADAARDRTMLDTLMPPAPEARIEDLRYARAELGYDPAAHAALRERVQQTAAGADGKALAVARSEITAAEAAVAEREAELRTIAGDEGAIARRLAEMPAPAAPDLAAQAEAARRRHEETDRSARQWRERATNLESKAAGLGAFLERARDIQRRRDQAAERRSLALDLAKACGKKGVPWMIVRDLRPELEAEANEILGLVSDGELSVSLRTETEIEGGQMRETLRVRVHRGDGDMDFARCSGGQAFKVALSLRVALGRLLARRAGAKLQLLFVDEGFGSQDEESLPLVLEAIRSIAPLFAKIVVISHLREVKEGFVHRIEVSDGQAGAQVRLIA